MVKIINGVYKVSRLTSALLFNVVEGIILALKPSNNKTVSRVVSYKLGEVVHQLFVYGLYNHCFLPATQMYDLNMK